MKINIAIRIKIALRFLLWWFLLAVSLQTCANRKAPPGGPEDKSPPQVTATFPTADSTNIAHLEYLEFQFNESVDRASLRDQVWMLPELSHGFELRWKGDKKLRIVLNDSLDKDQTYILTIGTGVRDLRNNNLDEPLILPFSTGPVIDTGRISGRVIGENIEGVFIYTYQVSDSFSERSIFEYKPRYYTQVGKSGAFQIRYLKPDTYRIYALDDQNADRLYTLQVDRIGIPSVDIRLDSTLMEYRDLNFTLIREDTTGPQSTRVNPVNNRTLEILFNESLDIARTFQISIQDSIRKKPLTILATQVENNQQGELIVFTERQESTIYLGTLGAVKDVTGNLSDQSAFKFRFEGDTSQDTVRMRLVKLFPGKDRGDVPYDASVRFEFTLPADTLLLTQHVQLLDEDSALVAGRWHFASPSKPEFFPDTLLRRGSVYRLVMDLPNVRSVFGDSLGDSLYVHRFTTVDFSELGEIGGIVTADKPAWEKMIVTAALFRGNGEHSVTSRSGIPYQIPYLPAGNYKLKAIIDVNANGRYDAGSSIPFEFCEPFFLYPDTVKVRKRWTTDGIDFHFD